MKKIDGLSLVLSIIINLIILLYIPGLNIKTVINQKIKVGLVSLDNNRKMKINTPKKENTNTTQKSILNENANNQKNQIEQQQLAQKQPDKTKQPDPPKKDQGNINILTSTSGKRSTALPSDPLNATKELNEGIKTKTEKLAIASTDTKLDPLEEIKEKKEKFETPSTDKLPFNSEVGEDATFDRVLTDDAGAIGLPSGYKLGTEDGSIVARWDSSNKEPVYPESAQLKGKYGSVRIKMKIDENGNILSFILDKGSGVPEINQAIEEVGRTWKIYLSRNGLNVKGDVILEYNFTLKGQK